jgi:hypothetical protein
MYELLQQEELEHQKSLDAIYLLSRIIYEMKTGKMTAAGRKIIYL